MTTTGHGAVNPFATVLPVVSAVPVPVPEPGTVAAAVPTPKEDAPLIGGRRRHHTPGDDLAPSGRSAGIGQLTYARRRSVGSGHGRADAVDQTDAAVDQVDRLGERQLHRGRRLSICAPFAGVMFLRSACAAAGEANSSANKTRAPRLADASRCDAERCIRVLLGSGGMPGTAAAVPGIPERIRR